MENVATCMFVGLVFIGLAIPHIKEKIPPNKWCGFRTKKTLSDKEIWYKANKYMGKELLKAGCAIIAMALLLFIFKSRLPAKYGEIVFLVIITIPVAITLVKCLLYLRKL